MEVAFQSASWDAVKEAGKLGANALPVIEKYSRDENYQKRQIAVASAAAIQSEAAVPIFIAGLDDDNVNVRIAAAKAINENPYPALTDAVLSKIENCNDEVIKESLVLSAGKLPGDKTIEVLKKVNESDSGQVSENAEMALARLGDTEAKSKIVEELSDEIPGIRYQALEKLIYIKDRRLLPYAKRLLGDKTEAIKFGNIKAPKYRRVCDQAVETALFLGGVSASFVTAKDRIYGDREIREVEEKTSRT